MLPADPLANVLYVDLTTRSSRIEHRPELFAARLGGTGAAIRLLDEAVATDADPLGPGNAIVLAPGALTGHYPLASKTVALFRSPLTGNLGESHCGGRSAVAIRMAGFGAVVVTGRSATPVYLSIHGHDVRFRYATALWGARGTGTVGRVIREREPGAGQRSIMRIGRAGERQIAYACVTSETYRHFGRLGLGAVFGSKHLKAIAIGGQRGLPVHDLRAYRRTYKALYDAAVSSELMKKYHDLGTAVNVLKLDRLEGLPTRNLQAGRFEGAKNVSGEALAEHYLGRRLACAHCPVGCIHIAALREPYEREAYYYKTSMISYDYELIYALGSLLGVGDPDGLLKLMDEVEQWGLDAMSAGVALAWATEAMQQGLIDTSHTGGLALAFGDWATYLAALEALVEQGTDFWRDLGRGVAHAASIYGGEDFALSFGGNEMPGYHTGAAAHAGVLVGGRHSHLCNGGYSLDQKALARGEAPDPDAFAKGLIEEEAWRQVLSSLVVCFFARKVYGAEVIADALGSIGFETTPEALVALGETIYRDKFRFKLRTGYSFDDLSIPRRVLETPGPGGPVDEAVIRGVIARVKAFHEADPGS